MIKYMKAPTPEGNLPVIYCDICSERIDDLELGAVVSPRIESEGETARILYVHKGPCHDLAEN